MSLPGPSGKRHRDDLVGIDHRAIAVAALLDGVDMLHTLHDLAPDRILAIEPGRSVEADEELAVGAVGIAAARHRAGAPHVGLAREFGLEIGLLRSARAGARGIARLCHEPRDHPVKDDAVVETVLREL